MNGLIPLHYGHSASAQQRSYSVTAAAPKSRRCGRSLPSLASDYVELLLLDVRGVGRRHLLFDEGRD
jgi:hypothetical protein